MLELILIIVLSALYWFIAILFICEDARKLIYASAIEKLEIKKKWLSFISNRVIVVGGGDTDLVPADVVPFSLGLANSNGKMDVFIERNTKLPVKVTKTWSSIRRNMQQKFTFQIYEGERLLASTNKKLGEFSLDTCQTDLNWEVAVEVTFAINKHGELRVTAEDKSIGAKNGITVIGYKRSQQFSKREVERVVAEAVRFRANCRDENKVAQLTAKDTLFQFCHKVKEEIKENKKQQLTADDEESMVEKCDSALSWLDQEDNVFFAWMMSSRTQFETRLAELQKFYAQISASFSECDEADQTNKIGEDTAEEKDDGVKDGGETSSLLDEGTEIVQFN